MIVMKHYLKRQDIYKATWRSPDGKTMNQNDHVLIKKGDQKLIYKVQTHRGPYGNCDRFMLCIKMTQLVPKSKNKNQGKAKM